jgi:hypothetical protein
MDANTLYKLMKPHLELLSASEKKSLLKMVNSSRPGKITCQHRKVMPVTKAKMHLKEFCLQEIEKEQNGRTAL